MQYQAYSQSIETYDLADGYSLELAYSNTTDFVHHWAAYRPNESYHQDWTQRYSDLQGVPFAFWIMKDNQRIGGCLMRPNMLGELFLIPPFGDYDTVLTYLLPLLKHWSDEEKPITAFYVLPEQVEALVKMGFDVAEQRRWMIRPVMPYSVEFDSQFSISQPSIDEAESYAEVFFAAFSGGVGSYGKRDQSQHLKSIENHFDEQALLEASLIIRDRETGKIATICLVSEFGGHASINFVVTHPDFQKRGLGKKAMQYALNALYGKYPWMILAVTIGNPAEQMYHKMGFQRGIVVSTMTLS